jgi:transcriptional regulator with XRE-family HTH domain
MELKSLKKDLMQNPEFKREYERYDLAFEIGQMLLEARIQRGLTQEALAELVDTQQPSIARLESGKYLPSLRFLNKIAEAVRAMLTVRFDFPEVKVIEKSSSEIETPPPTVDTQQPYLLWTQSPKNSLQEVYS